MRIDNNNPEYQWTSITKSSPAMPPEFSPDTVFEEMDALALLSDLEREAGSEEAVWLSGEAVLSGEPADSQFVSVSADNAGEDVPEGESVEALSGGPVGDDGAPTDGSQDPEFILVPVRNTEEALSGEPEVPLNEPEVPPDELSSEEPPQQDFVFVPFR